MAPTTYYRNELNNSLFQKYLALSFMAGLARRMGRFPAHAVSSHSRPSGNLFCPLPFTFLLAPPPSMRFLFAIHSLWRQVPVWVKFTRGLTQINADSACANKLHTLPDCYGQKISPVPATITARTIAPIVLSLKVFMIMPHLVYYIASIVYSCTAVGLAAVFFDRIAGSFSSPAVHRLCIPQAGEAFRRFGNLSAQIISIMSLSREQMSPTPLSHRPPH
jgi:hypothetical protein